ncbi:MAG TPA: serine hydrolase domain-containing protein, partial [Planctomycetota bacterium]|nr:serine hydrolase domain-containing protein [Planctomycetota bacterium]
MRDTWARSFSLLAVTALALAPEPRAQVPHGDLDEAIQTYMQTGHIPGVAAAIIKGDQVVWAKGYGTANFELGTTVSLDTPFFLASISKTATATALMQLRDEGLFALDDDTNDDLPFDIVNPQVHISGVTYRQLLTHTAALQDNWTIMDPLYQPGDSVWQLEDFHPEYWVPGGVFYNPMQNFYPWAPGSAYSYCNQGFSLLGLLGQELAGVPFDDLCKQRVFEPLGMTHTSFRLSDFDPATLAMPYNWDWDVLDYVAEGHYGYPDWPAGTLRSSILDLARFLRAFSNGGATEGVRLLPPATVAEMLTVQFPAPDPQGLCFYYLTTPFAGTIVGHDGGDPGVLTDMYFRPSDGTGVILFANSEGGFGEYWSIFQRLWIEADLVSEAWHHLGQGLDGSNGQPYLEAKGDLVAGQPFELELERALPGAAAYLLFGLAPLNAPFKGGTLVPDVGAAFGGLLPLVTDPLGEIDLGGTWPAGVPSGTTL